MSKKSQGPGAKAPPVVKEVESVAVTHNFEGLRDALFDEFNLLRANKISIARAKTTSSLARRIIEAATLDLFAQGLLGEQTPKRLKKLTAQESS